MKKRKGKRGREIRQRKITREGKKKREREERKRL